MALEASEVAVRVKLLGGAAFKAEADSTAGSLDKIGAAGRRSGTAVAAGTAGSGKMLGTMGAKANKVGGQMIGLGRTMTMAGIPIAAVGYLASKASSQFGQAMTLLSTQANMPFKSITKMSNAVEDMAPKMGATPLALAQALYPIESIGLRGQKAMNALKAAAMGSAVGLDSLENTADAVTTAMASRIKGTGGPVQAMAIMDRSIGLGKMHLQDLTESFKSGIIPIAQQFGLSFKQILAAASGLTRVGIPANQVMARMRLTLTSMIAPTTAGHKAMHKLGLTQFQLADDLRSPGGLLTALADIKSHMAAFGHPDEANALVASMFGKSRGMASIGSLLNQLPQIQGIYSKVMGTTQQTLDTHFAQTQGTSAFKFKQVQSSLQVALIKLGDSVNKYLLPALAKLVPIVTSVVNWFGHLPGGIQKFLMVLLAAVVVGGPLLMFTGALVKAGGLLVGVFSSAIEAVVGPQALAGLGEAAGATRLGFMALVPELAAAGAALGIIAVAHKPIEQAGKYAGGQLARGIATSLSTLGITNAPRDYIATKDYLASKQFQSLRADQRAAIEFRLGHPHAKLTGRNAALAGMGFGGNILKGLNLPKLPGLATGGLVTHAGLAMVGETGPELLSLPRGAMVQPSTRSNLPQTSFPGDLLRGQSQSDTIVTQVVLDGRVVGESVNQYNRKRQNRR